ncbi:helix-turn-helix transcriptional regulator [Aeromonas simiae]|uniref:Helix-turn-helix transcriptional regulator n=1 Tax=Aeromonas simiae TaxID=218936 RepID=A0A5J6X1Z5_9GAMM|nr:helix-turn-helix transcriptional regulator [Aeromonas simiae]QFI56143.1 helix-turn-helix transcriptional regulator [Aeromonas simiae]
MKSLSMEARESLLCDLLVKLQRGEIHEGELLRKLRKEVLGMDQEGYAKLVGISRRTLSDIERNRAAPSLKMINQVFRPFSMKMMLMPKSRALQEQIATRLNAVD